MDRRSNLAKANAFHRDEAEAEPTSLNAVDGDLFGKLRGKEAGRQVAKPTPIAHIWPDARQPRRAIPSLVRAGWDGDPAGVPAMLDHWIGLVDEERGRPFMVAHYLDQKGDAERSDHVGPLESALLEVVVLAASILHSGLANPISVVESGQAYRIETGERRWLAYHLLLMFLEDTRWEKIPAHVVDQSNVWRQAAENNARANLNAIGKARQYALLIMDLYPDVPFHPLDAFEHERQFYAQVIGLDIPHGSRERLMQGMGLRGKAETTRCRQLLGLPDSVWSLADDLNAPQQPVLNCAKLPEEQALSALKTWFQLGTITTNSKGAGGDLDTHKSAIQSATKLLRAIAKGQPVRRDDYDQLRRWLDEAADRIEFLE